MSSLLALTTLAVTQPLLDLLGRNASFLVAHDAGAVDVVGLAVGVALVLPLAAAAAVLAVRRLHAPAAAALHTAMVGALVAVGTLVVLRVAGDGAGPPGAAALAVAAAGGAGMAAAYRRSAALRWIVGVSALAAPLVAGMFVFASPARALVFPPPSAAALDGVPVDAPPVVMVVFDELPVASLLDRDGAVDSAAFPAFARLAADATFLRNITAVAGQTSDALPALLSGRYPQAGDGLPIVADHPRNLFTLLSGTYDLHVVEPLTQLCPPSACSTGGADAGWSDYRTLLADLTVVGSHLVVPADLAGGLPPLDAGWRDFRGAAATSGKEIAVRDRFRAARQTDPAAAFEVFVGNVEPRPRPTLHFLHTLLPHSPWIYLPDGRRYADTEPAAGLVRGRWSDDPWLAAQGYQRHLLQLQHADRLLGRLLDRLQGNGMYDDALIVVAADHGASLRPGTSLRVLADSTVGEIAAVPLLVKRPGQDVGRASDHAGETVDVVPTILDAIGAEPPAGMDGRSIFDQATERRFKRYFDGREVVRLDATGTQKWQAVERKLALLDGGPDPGNPQWLAPPEGRRLLGVALAGIPVSAATGVSAALVDPQAYSAIDTTAARLPALIRGVVRGLPGPVDPPLLGVTDPPLLAVAVNGTIAAVTLGERTAGDTHAFRALVPAQLLRDGANPVEVLLVGSDRLAKVPLESG